MDTAQRPRRSAARPRGRSPLAQRAGAVVRRAIAELQAAWPVVLHVADARRPFQIVALGDGRGVVVAVRAQRETAKRLRAAAVHLPPGIELAVIVAPLQGEVRRAAVAPLAPLAVGSPTPPADERVEAWLAPAG